MSLDPLSIALQGLVAPLNSLSVAAQGFVQSVAPALTHTSGGGSGVQFAQKRRRAKLLAQTQEDEEMAMVMAVLAEIGVFA